MVKKMPGNKIIAVGGIIKHADRIGFKISFPNKEIAQKYKEAFIWYMESDGYKIDNKRGYYDVL